jgi:stage II sporulation protein M
MKKKGFLKDNYKKSFNYIKECKEKIYLGLILFFIFGLLGFFFPYFFEQEILEFIKNVSEKTIGMNVLETILFIFFNNLKACFVSIIFGFFFGLIPIIITITNAYLIGFVSRKVVSQEGFFVLWKLLPHGIFELPAFFLSIGLGINLGMSFFRKGDSWKNLKNTFRETSRVFVFVILVLLIIAATIEGLLVYYLK